MSKPPVSVCLWSEWFPVFFNDMDLPDRENLEIPLLSVKCYDHPRCESSLSSFRRDEPKNSSVTKARKSQKERKTYKRPYVNDQSGKSDLHNTRQDKREGGKEGGKERIEGVGKERER